MANSAISNSIGVARSNEVAAGRSALDPSRGGNAKAQLALGYNRQILSSLVDPALMLSDNIVVKARKLEDCTGS
jgi:hypothetical protein